MNLELIVNVDERDLRLRRVVSLTDLSRLPVPSLVYRDRVQATIYLVNAANAYDASSGLAGIAPRLALGPRGESALAYTETFALITNGWSCTLDLNTAELAKAIRDNRRDLALSFETTATGPNQTTWLSSDLAVLGRVENPAAGVALASPTYLTAAEIAAIYASAANSYFYPSLFFFGNLALQTFDYFKARAATRIIGAQLALQSLPPTGADVTIDLVDSLGNEFGKISTITAGSTFQETIFATPLDLAAGAYVRGKVKTRGSINPGGYLDMKLICQPII